MLKLKSSLIWGFRGVLVIVIFYYVFYSFNLGIIVNELNITLIYAAGMSSLFSVLCIIPRLFRLKQYLSSYPHVENTVLMKSIWLSYGLSNIMPGRISELVKPMYLKDKANIPITVSLSTLLFERFSDVIFFLNITL